MYGVPENLDLTFLHGREVVQIRLGLYQIQLHFHPDATIAVEGEWELFDAEGRELDRMESPRTKPFQLHRLLGKLVAGSEVSPPLWFALRFEGGELLRVYDRETQYESFSIQPGNIFV